MATSNNPNGMAGMEEILELARLLRKNGDTVLSGASKLSLSTKLLHNLNDAFSIIVDDKQEIDSSFQVCNSSKNDVFRNIKFLHDFVQKTIWLKVSHNCNDPRIPVDISKFRQLRFLELRKVCIDLVSGIQGVRGQLESISCTGGGGVGTVGRLLASCGRDAGVGFVWASMKRLALPYNGLGRLDKSLELAPWLQTLDLSHNLIISTSELDCLPSLKYVNLGYNKLEAAPTLNKATYHTLQILVLRNNYIENLNGLQGLDCLAELDLSYNCLDDHSVLWPLETMSALLWVALEGNPLAYYKKHRLLTIKHLHSALSESKFVLDHEPLSKTEKMLVSHNRTFMIRSAPSPSKDDQASMTSSIMSNVTLPSVENTYHNDLLITQRSDLMEGNERMATRNRKKKYVCEAIITDEDTKENTTDMSSSIASSLLETSADHLETKKQILALRAKFGDEKWLVSDAGSFVQDIMGLERSVVPTLQIASGLDPSLHSVVTTVSTKYSTNFSTDSAVWSNESSSDDVATESAVLKGDEVEREENDIIVDESEGDKTINIKDQIESLKVTEPLYDPGEETGELYLVQQKSNSEEMQTFFLVITPEEIKEIDWITGRLRYRWSTDTVLSCVMGRGETPTIDFIFDTTRKDRQNRTYFVEKEDAPKIVKTVGDLIKVRPILLKVFKCMKCSTHFSQDPDYVTGVTTTTISSIKPPKCPTCRSTLVIQTDELLTPDVEDAKKDFEKSPSKSHTDENTVQGNLQHSGSHSSIGGTEGGPMLVTTSLVQYDSRPQAQVSCSATSLEESRESTPSASTVTKRYESDIEILSNPSQSSIEVLDDGTKASSTPNRKRSSEERRVAIAPTLLTIPDTAPVMTGLTESSSSGSLTDSICTAYENKALRTPGIASKRNDKKMLSGCETPTNSEPSKIATSTTPVGNLTSMLGGLLQSMKIVTPKSTPTKPEEATDFLETDIEYSYDDFGSVDHRIKLHLVLNVFEQENEKFRMLLRAQMIMQDSTEPFQGCLVLSNCKVYVLKIIGPESGDPQRWLSKEMSWTHDKLRCIAPLPFKQGVLVELVKRNVPKEDPIEIDIVCILQDFKRTSNLLYYLTDLGLPFQCQLDSTAPSHYKRVLLDSMDLSSNWKSWEEIRILAFFTLASFTQNDDKMKLKSGGLIVTDSAILLTGEKVQWLLPISEEKPQIIAEHAISNLIEVGHRRCLLDLSFIDEVGGVEDIWRLVFVSSDAAKAVINAIEAPWEKLFSVPLQVTNKAL
ncbi:serine/threonine-protein kinase 11-interacting protein isoform X2 [Venturia canescens]|uniref:serine/threonine-protein kinase 11-interacting protein isoform X2 n=1 Tax=Venturia canescens TaxID=32260 RepID=UPI001C9CB59B|nr:serine/threonine-protein kinase 11-interacting protein isoform X2 [Venturia canescens]